MSVMVDGSNIRGNGVLGVALRVVLVSIVAIIGWNIALPGLDASFMAARTADGVPSQLSVLALGVGPVLTAFALGQIIRLLVPRWKDSFALLVGENVVALLLAASQAYAIAKAMSAMGLLVGDGYLAWAGFVASLIGGTAVLLFLSRQVVLPSLVAGFWILWLLPALIDLPAQFSLSFDLLRTGAVAGSQLLLTMVVVIIAFALAISATRIVMTRQNRSAPTKMTPFIFLLNIVVWPPLLAASAGSYVLTPMAFLWPDSLPDGQWIRIYVLAMTAILIPVFVFGYRRFFSRNGLMLPTTTALMLIAVQIALVLGGALVSGHLVLPLPLSGTTILVLVGVAYGLIDAIRKPVETAETGNAA